MRSKTKPTLFDEISSLCDDKSSLQARFALASYDTSPSSGIFEQGLMLFEYIQLLSPVLIVMITLNYNQDSSLLQPVLFLSRLINPAYWMSFDKTGFLEILMIVLVCSFTVFKVLLCLYIFYRCKRGYEASGVLVSIWKAFMKFQSRITYFYVLSFYVSAMRVINWETYESIDDQSGAIKILALVLILFELLLALLPKIRYHDLFPTSSFLSARDNTLEMITIVQKFVVEILFATLNFNLSGSNWAFGLFNLCMDVVKIGHFFRRLPLYSLKALYFQGWLLMIVATLNLSFFISVVIKGIDESYTNLSLSIIFWVILAIFAIKSSNNALRRAYWKLVCDPSLDCPYLLVHRVLAIKELRENTKMHMEHNSRYDFSLLTNKTLNSHAKEILMMKGDNENMNMDINSRETSNKLFAKFLEKLTEKYPRNQYVKIFLAEFYFKHMNLYGDPIRMCLLLKKSGDFKIRINAELLLIKIQNDLQKRFRDLYQEKKSLDLLAYISQQAFVAKLKQEMLRQTGLQIKVCSEIMNDTPNLEMIYANSQKAHFARRTTIRRINHISSNLSEFNVEPLLLAAKYHLLVNHSIQNYLHFNKLYSQRLTKYQKYFAQEKLCQQNLFQENGGFLFISSAKGHEGEIVYATKSIQKMFGGDSTQFSGVSFVQKTPAIYHSIYSLAWKNISEDPQNGFLDKIIRAFGITAEGHLIEVEYFLGMHPFPTQGFNLVFPMRQIVSNREYLLLHENGDIDSASKGVLEKLGLSSETVRMNIRRLNEELGIVNEAFNMMAFPHKYENEVEQQQSPVTPKNRISLSKFEAEEIYNRFTTTGSNIGLKSFENPGLFYSYNCKMKNEIFGPLIIKTLILEENKRENRERTNEFLSPMNVGGSNRTWSPTGKFGGGEFSNSSNNSFRTEQEKEDGWIDFDVMTTRRSPFDIPLTDGEKENFDTTQREDQDLTQRQLIVPTSSTRENKRFLQGTTLKKMVTMKKSTGLGHLTDSTNEWMGNYEYTGNNKKAQASKSSKNHSKFTQQKKISNSFQLSLDTKYYTKTFWGLFGLFFITLGVLAILRVAIKLKLDHDMDVLVAKKDIFSTNGYRNYLLIDGAGLIRFVWQFYSGALNLSDYGFLWTLSFYVTRLFVSFNARNLQAANTDVLKTLPILSEDTQIDLYQKNVKVYNNYFDDVDQSYFMMDSFQATDRIIEASLDVYQTFLNSSLMSSDAKAKVQFLLRNSLNDLVIANNEMSSTMLDSFNNQFDQVKAQKASFTIFFIAFLCVFLVLFLAFLFNPFHAQNFFMIGTS